ncbi:hypothetical protein T12_4012 [Trichinella patagoniensis]|uniref:Uncharacterized protein n=1 Tax=Trichinella patagoniensis TaxID=990121 RepID=A0A0V1A586_9BILA|nr:hypothetical protein T12_4012 [Trichinella patagoniensis]
MKVVADIDFHLKFRFLIFFYWSRVTDSLVISFNVEHRVLHCLSDNRLNMNVNFVGFCFL